MLYATTICIIWAILIIVIIIIRYAAHLIGYKQYQFSPTEPKRKKKNNARLWIY